MPEGERCPRGPSPGCEQPGPPSKHSQTRSLLELTPSMQAEPHTAGFGPEFLSSSSGATIPGLLSSLHLLPMKRAAVIQVLMAAQLCQKPTLKPPEGGPPHPAGPRRHLRLPDPGLRTQRPSTFKFIFMLLSNILEE